MATTRLIRSTLVAVFFVDLVFCYFTLTQRRNTAPLPDANTLLRTYFRVLYEKPSVARFYTARQKQMIYFVKPDVMQLSAFKGKRAPELTELTSEEQQQLQRVDEQGLNAFKPLW